MIRKVINESRIDGFRKGQQIEIQSPFDNGTEIVTYIGPGESSQYFYCMDGAGRVKHFKYTIIVNVLPYKATGGDKRKKTMYAKKLKEKIAELEEQIQDLMMEQEEYAAQIIAENPEKGIDAPNEDEYWQSLWDSIDSLTSMLGKCQTELDQLSEK